MGKQLEWKQVPTWVTSAEDGPYTLVLMITENAPGPSCTISQTKYAGSKQTAHETRQAEDLKHAQHFGQLMFEQWEGSRQSVRGILVRWKQIDCNGHELGPIQVVRA